MSDKQDHFPHSYLNGEECQERRRAAVELLLGSAFNLNRISQMCQLDRYIVFDTRKLLLEGADPENVIK